MASQDAKLVAKMHELIKGYGDPMAIEPERIEDKGKAHQGPGLGSTKGGFGKGKSLECMEAARTRSLKK